MCVGKIPSIGDLSESSWKDKILDVLDRMYWMVQRPIDLKIAVIGPKDCGKTSVIRRFAGDIFYEEKCNPLENVFCMKTVLKINKKLRRFDTEIIELQQDDCKYEETIAKATGYILVYDANSPYSYQELSVLISKLHNGKKRKPPIVVVGNKCEQCITMNQVGHNIEIRDDVESSGIKYFSTSAQLNSGICDAFDEIIEQCAWKNIWTLPTCKSRRNNEEHLVNERLIIN